METINKLDIRTLIFTTILFGALYGIGFILYSKTQRRFQGLSLIGLSELAFTVGFLFLSLRHIAPDFLTVVIANGLIFAGSVILFEGLCRFREIRSRLSWLGPVLLILLLFIFDYLTFQAPNLKMRIVTICFFNFIQLTLCTFVVYYKPHPYSLKANILTGIPIALNAIYNLFRAIWTLGESGDLEFFLLGNIHSLSLVLMDIGLLTTAFGVIWIASSILEFELKEQARIDPLTKILNRRALEERAITELARLERHHAELSILILDIDHFKLINDTYGHLAGDTVLIEFAALLVQCTRINDIVARYGGEEFLIILPDTNMEDALSTAKKILEKIRSKKFAAKNSIIISASIGVATKREVIMNWESLVRAADKALYRAKRKGRDRIEIADYSSGVISS